MSSTGERIAKGDRVKFWCRRYDDYLHGVVISDGPHPVFRTHEVKCTGDHEIWSVPDHALVREKS